MKTFTIICLGLIIICQHLISHDLHSKEPWQVFTPTSEELQTLTLKSSEYSISQAELSKWDDIAKVLMLRYPDVEGGNSRLTAYLYNAQKAFADASFTVTGSYAGTLDPISQNVLQLFFPDYQAKEEPLSQRDPFSNALASIIAKKVEARFTQEKSHIHPVAIVEEKDAWHGKAPYSGIINPSMQPWFITLKDFPVPPPPSSTSSSFWQEQLEQVKTEMAKATPHQNYEILFWAGIAPPGSGDFIDIANAYMQAQNVPIKKQLEARALLTAALMDAMIAGFDAKYKYMVRRANMLDPSLKTYIRTPNHPSYPAAHSVCAGTSATVLSHYFPENQKNWEKLAEECGLSRINAGVHFPIDHLSGQTLGQKIGRFAISQ